MPSKRDEWTMHHFSLANPQGEGQDDVAALLKRVADAIRSHGEIRVHDITYHDEIDEQGEHRPTMTVYYEREGTSQLTGMREVGGRGISSRAGCHRLPVRITHRSFVSLVWVAGPVLLLGGYCRCRCSSGNEQRSESCRRVRPHPRRYVAVKVECGLNVIVPQALAHGIHGKPKLATLPKT